MGTTIDRAQHRVMEQTHRLRNRLGAVAADLEREAGEAMRRHSASPSSYNTRHEALIGIAARARDRLNVILAVEGAVDDTTIRASHERRMREVQQELTKLAGNIEVYLHVDESPGVQLPA